MLEQSIRKLTRILFFLGALCFLSILVLTMVQIGLRGVGESIRGSVELSGYLGAAAMGLCLPWVQYAKAHATAGICCARLSPAVQAFQEVLVAAICLILTSIFTFELYDLTLFVHEGMEVVDGWDIASALFVAALTVGCAGQALVLALQLVKSIQNMTLHVRFFTSKLLTPSMVEEA